MLHAMHVHANGTIHSHGQAGGLDSDFWGCPRKPPSDHFRQENFLFWPILGQFALQSMLGVIEWPHYGGGSSVIWKKQENGLHAKKVSLHAKQPKSRASIWWGF